MKKIVLILLSILVVLAFAAIAYAATASDTGPPGEIKTALNTNNINTAVDPQMGLQSSSAPAEPTTKIFFMNDKGAKGAAILYS